jgi:hypothetical protein
MAIFDPQVVQLASVELSDQTLPLSPRLTAGKFPQLTDGDPKVFKVFAKLFAVDQGAMI